ncbi:MAG TPA: ribonucleotide reductase N-terminal alpha domain-containing protein, partial [Trichormus sp.]
MFSENARKVLEKRYFLRDQDGGVVEDEARLFRRVADAIAQAELNWNKNTESVSAVADKFFAAM